MKANVHPLNVRRSFGMPLDKLDSYEGIKAIAQMLRQWERLKKENTFTAMAKKVNLHPKTIANIASEATHSPRLHTILAIMVGLGFSLVRFE